MNKHDALGHRIKLVSSTEAAGMATASSEDSSFPENEGLFDALCNAVADNVNGLIVGASVGLVIVAALFHTSW